MGLVDFFFFKLQNCEVPDAPCKTMPPRGEPGTGSVRSSLRPPWDRAVNSSCFYCACQVLPVSGGRQPPCFFLLNQMWPTGALSVPRWIPDGGDQGKEVEGRMRGCGGPRWEMAVCPFLGAWSLSASTSDLQSCHPALQVPQLRPSREVMPGMSDPWAQMWAHGGHRAHLWRVHDAKEDSEGP